MGQRLSERGRMLGLLLLSPSCVHAPRLSWTLAFSALSSRTALQSSTYGSWRISHRLSGVYHHIHRSASYSTLHQVSLATSFEATVNGAPLNLGNNLTVSVSRCLQP